MREKEAERDNSCLVCF